MADSRCKYYKQKKQVSYDNGVTWYDVIPYEYQKGELYETESQDCGYVPPVTEYRWVKTNDTTCVEEGPEVQYRWVNMDASVDYYCEGTTKYYKQKKQVSFDGGQTWRDVVPAEYQKGGVAEEQSTDCGYVPPTPTVKKLVANYNDGTTNEVDCNDNPTLTSGETRPSKYQNSKMTSAVIGNCVTSIGDWAFQDCYRLTSVTIPDSVTSIRSHAFQWCSGLPNITIPSSVITIGNYAFSGCSSFTSVIIPDSVTTIGEEAFKGCSGLTSVTIGSGVTTIGNYAFTDCYRLTSINIPNSVTTIGSYAFGGCSGLTSVTIGNSVTSIGDSAFSGCRSLPNITIPSSVTSIGAYAFASCSGLTSINIPNSVTTIGNSAFQNCHNITSCTIGSGVTYIDNYAFYRCSGLTSVTINATTPPRIGYYPFGNLSIFVPCESVNAYKTSWSTYADKIQGIQPCNITKLQVSYSDGTTREVECNSSVALTSGETQPSGYDYDKMTNAVIGDCVTSIGGSAFFMCYSLTSVTIPNTVTRINSHAFHACGLTSVTIPSSVTRIDGYAFAYCGSLTSVTIPSSVTTIGGAAFAGCDSLTSITVNATTPPTLGSGVFDYTNNCPIYVPCESLFTYKTAENWSAYASRIQGIPPCEEPPTPTNTKFVAYYSDGKVLNVECNSDGTLTSGETQPSRYDYDKMTSAEIGDCVTSIGDSTFANCYNLTSVTIGSSVTSISDSAFANCYSLRNIIIPDSVTSIGMNAFASCGLNSVTIGSGVTSIGSSAFSGCSNLTSIEIPSGVTSISNNTFRDCTSLTNAVIPDSVTSIGNSAFSGCSNLTSIEIPSGVTSISDWVFWGCNNLKKVNSNVDGECNIPNLVTEIGYQAFRGCVSLTSLTIPSGVTSISDQAFYVCRSLTSITVEAVRPPTLGHEVFRETNNCPIYVPASSVEIYKTSGMWKYDYASRIQPIP